MFTQNAISTCACLLFCFMWVFLSLLAFDNFFFLGHLSNLGDQLLWVGVRGGASSIVRRASCVLRRALTSSSQEPMGQS